MGTILPLTVQNSIQEYILCPYSDWEEMFLLLSF